MADNRHPAQQVVRVNTPPQARDLRHGAGFAGTPDPDPTDKYVELNEDEGAREARDEFTDLRVDEVDTGAT